MRRAAILAAGLMSFAAAGCDETYDAVNGSVPAQVVVRDDGDKIDARNIRAACEGLGGKPVRVQYIGNGRTEALVTCQ